jgi:hypothetical protein
MTTPLTSAAVGSYASAATAAPVGYQPCTKYWRTMATNPAAEGVAIDVPSRGRSARVEGTGVVSDAATSQKGEEGS